MNAVCYQLLVTGLSEGGGPMRVSQFLNVVGALARTARRATRLLATGSGSLNGGAIGWLADATDFAVTGLEPGSTVIEVVALPLGVAAPAQFARRKHGAESHAEATALDLAAWAVEEAKNPDSDGKWFDSAVLEAILDFPFSTCPPAVTYALIPVGTNSPHRSFSLEPEARQSIQKRFQAMPPPRGLVAQPEDDTIRLDSTYSINLDRITDRWPGDESIEELMEMLD